MHDHAGRWTDENTLELEWRGEEEGKEALEQTTFHWLSSVEVSMETVNTVGGHPGHTIAAAWRKSD